ncbi:MAG: PKD domain-containing protein [Thermoplasmata archaeon]|nr:PKD domain-containing protein [Thermoplasmata archaeon]
MIVSTSFVSIEGSADVPRNFNIKPGYYWTYLDEVTFNDGTGMQWLNTTESIEVIKINQTAVGGNLTDVYVVMTKRSGTLVNYAPSSGFSIASLESSQLDLRLYSNYSLVFSQLVSKITSSGMTINLGYFLSFSSPFDDFAGDEVLSLGWNETSNSNVTGAAWVTTPPLPPIFPEMNTTTPVITPMNMTMEVVAENVSVTTPAGTFSCFMINVTVAPDFMYSGLPLVMGSIPFATMTLYYSYDVGNFVVSNYCASGPGVALYRNQTLLSYFYSSDGIPPVANAGPDRTVIAGTKGALNGTLSSDPTNTLDELNFTWNFTYDGSMCMVYGPVPDFIFLIVGTYNVTLTVRDPALNYDITWVIITVIPDTSIPIARAGPDQNIIEGNWAVLDGSSSSDSVNSLDELEFTWTFEYDSADKTLDGPIVIFLFDEIGDYEIELEVADPVGNSDVDSLWVYVTAVDLVPPVANAGQDQSVQVNTNVKFNGSASSDNVKIANWTWNFNYNGTNVTLYGPGPEFEFNLSGTYQVILIVRDASDNMAADAVTITVGGIAAAEDLAVIGLSIALIIAILVAAFFAIIYMRKKK